MPTTSARVLALGGESRTAPIGRWQTDYYLQRIVVATCGVAVMVALLVSLIPARPGTLPGIHMPRILPNIVDTNIYRVAPPSVRAAESPRVTIRTPDMPMPKPVADSEVRDELERGATPGGDVLGDPTATTGQGADSPWLDGGLAPSRSAAPEVFLFVEVPPQLVSLTNPAYPELAREAGVEGTVHVKVLVSEEGFVLDALVLEGLPLLDEAALGAARSALFRPAQQSGQPVRTWVVMPIEFSLRR